MKTKGQRNLNDIFIIDGSNQNNWHLDVALEGIMDGDSWPVYDHLISCLFDEISMLPNDMGVPTHLLRYTGLPVLNKGKVDEAKPVISDIKKEALSFAKPRIFNDPMDPILREWLIWKKNTSHSSFEKKLFQYLSKSLDNLRICCLSRKDGRGRDSVQMNPIMWAHYADKHKGICIEYEITNDMLAAHNSDNQVLRICDVRYRNRKVMNDYITLDNALLAKGEPWKYENETRLIYYNKDDISTTRQAGNYMSLTGFRIKAIYLGYRISEENKNEIISVCRDKDISLFQVRFDVGDVTSLVAERI